MLERLAVTLVAVIAVLYSPRNAQGETTRPRPATSESRPGTLRLAR